MNITLVLYFWDSHQLTALQLSGVIIARSDLSAQSFIAAVTMGRDYAAQRSQIQRPAAASCGMSAVRYEVGSGLPTLPQLLCREMAVPDARRSVRSVRQRACQLPQRSIAYPHNFSHSSNLLLPSTSTQPTIPLPSRFTTPASTHTTATFHTRPSTALPTATSSPLPSAFSLTRFLSCSLPRSLSPSFTVVAYLLLIHSTPPPAALSCPSPAAPCLAATRFRSPSPPIISSHPVPSTILHHRPCFVYPLPPVRWWCW